MSNKIIMIGLLFLMTGCVSTMKVSLESDDQQYRYELPFESGHILKEYGKLEVRLSFYRPEKSFKTDTDERLHIYIFGNDKDFEQNSGADGPKVFFIIVQLRPCYGFMNIKHLEIENIAGKRPTITGNLFSDSVYSVGGICKRIDLSFADLPIVPASSMDEMNKLDEVYYKQILKQRFSAW